MSKKLFVTILFIFLTALTGSAPASDIVWTNGSGNGRNGRNGQDCFIEVPMGTMVFSIEEGTEVLLADLVKEGEEVCAARGEPGGKGTAGTSLPEKETLEKRRPFF